MLCLLKVPHKVHWYCFSFRIYPVHLAYPTRYIDVVIHVVAGPIIFTSVLSLPHDFITRNGPSIGHFAHYLVSLVVNNSRGIGTRKSKISYKETESDTSCIFFKPSLVLKVLLHVNLSHGSQVHIQWKTMNFSYHTAQITLLIIILSPEIKLNLWKNVK